MPKTLQKSLYVFLGAIVVGVVIYYLQPKDPVYEGHKLSAWLMALNTGQDPLHGQADDALKNIGTNAFPTLIQWIRLKDSPLKLKLMELVNRQSVVKIKFTSASEFRSRAIIAFQQCGGRAKAVTPVLASLLDDSEIAADVTQALAGIGAASLPFLKEALHQKSATLRGCAANALALLGADAKSATPDLIALLGDQSPDVRRRAVWALGQIKGEPSIVLPALANCMNGTDADFRGFVVGAILNYGEAARSTIPVLLKAIIKALHDQSAKLRAGAASSLARLGADAKPATPDLIALLSDQSPDVRRNAVVALGQIKSEPASVAPALANCINDTDADVRRNAVWALGQIKSEPAIVLPALANGMNDTDADVRRSAVLALAHIKSEPAIVLSALANGVNDTDTVVRQIAVGAILNYGEAARSTVPILLKALNDQEPGVRELARLALMKIDPEAAANAGVK